MHDNKNIEYKFYRRVRRKEDQYIGALAEKRIKRERITCNSIMNYAKRFSFEALFEDRVYFIRVEI